MMTTEVTRQMWMDLKAVQPSLPDDPSNTSISPTLNHPVQDVTWYETYPAGSVTDPTGATSGTTWMVRGSAWSYDANFCRSAFRLYNPPNGRDETLGFRLIRAAD